MQQGMERKPQSEMELNLRICEGLNSLMDLHEKRLNTADWQRRVPVSLKDIGILNHCWRKAQQIHNVFSLSIVLQQVIAAMEKCGLRPNWTIDRCLFFSAQQLAESRAEEHGNKKKQDADGSKLVRFEPGKDPANLRRRNMAG